MDLPDAGGVVGTEAGEEEQEDMGLSLGALGKMRGGVWDVSEETRI